MDERDRQRWLALSPLLDELLDLDQPAREQRLEALDADTADQLRALLARDAELQAQGFMGQGAAEQLKLGATPAMEELPDLSGQLLGPYRLERELGQGGMGAVWLASRADGRFDGQVAVKFLKAGVFGSGDAGRFAREGRILARLSHPHIARLLDAGIYQELQPYLVLEYVDGQPIDAYCRDCGLDLQARIGLFLDVLAAVAHAHARLILHRDLKPSNILVTPAGEVKLLDFGIAKLLDDAADATELTRRAGNAYTPQYAAPEQVQQADVTTATDVYALGVLLYQLLGGGHPTAGDTRTELDRLKAIVELQPRPLSEAAAARPGEPMARHARELRGDLDTIVAKALKKAPAERYANAQALADDLRRWLAHEPIAARPDSRWYVAGRFVRRHRLAVTAGSVAVLALVSLATVSTLQARRAEAAEQQAEQRRQQSDELLAYMLGDFADKLRPIGKLELLDSIGGRALEHLAVDAPVHASERLNRAKALTVIGEVRVTRRELDKALEPLSAARELLAGDPPESGLTAAWRKAQGAAAFWAGQVHHLQRDFSAARQQWEAYREACQAWLAHAPHDREALLELSYALTNLGGVALEEGRVADAAQAFGESVGLKRRALQGLPDDKRHEALSELASSLSWLGQTQLWLGELQASVGTFHAALETLMPLRRAQPDDAPSTNREAILHRWLGEALFMSGRSDEAGAALRVAQARFGELVARDPSNRTWSSEALVTELLALEVTPPQPAALHARLQPLGLQLDQLEQASGAAGRVRRLPDRARWALLMWRTAPPAGRPAAVAAVEAVREALREALRPRPGQIRLARALARLDIALLEAAVPGQPACEQARQDLALLRELAGRDPLVSELARAAQPCMKTPEAAAVANARTVAAAAP
ncbi:MAG: protein kinase domain-containing protein [Roseateles sp.]